MKLLPLFDGELLYDELTHTAVAAYGDGRWFGYAPAHGTVWGPRLAGTVRCHNLYQQQRVEPELFRPMYRGAVETSDGALVLFEADGLNRFVDDTRGIVVMSMLFRTSDERYGWLNEIVASVEAICFATEEGSSETERWVLRGYECVNDLTDSLPNRIEPRGSEPTT